MARLTRLSVANEVHFVKLKANEEISLFPAVADIEALFRIFSMLEHSGRGEIAGYTLTSDEINLLLVPRGEDAMLSRSVQLISRLYSAHFNSSYSTTKSIWQGRFYSCVLHGAEFVLPALIFLESIPERKGLGEADRYPWTSYHHHIGARNDGFVFSPGDYWNLGNTPFERQKKYRSLFQEGVSEAFAEKLNSCIVRGWPCGDPKFLESLKVEEGRIRPLRARGRPAKS